VNPRIEEQAQWLITESTVSPFVRRLPGSPGMSVVYGLPIYVRGSQDMSLGKLLPGVKGGLIYSVGADLPLTTAQLMAIAESVIGG